MSRKRERLCAMEIDRKQLEHLQRGRCYFCARRLREWGESLLKTRTLEHLTPLSRGGRHSMENCALSCRDCNNEKGDMTVGEYREWLGMKGEFYGERIVREMTREVRVVED